MALRSEQPLYESSRVRCERDLVNEIQLIIPDKTQRKVLLAKVGPDEWRLPGFLSKDVHANSIPGLCSEVKTVIGFDFPFVVLREVHSQLLEVDRPDIEALLSRDVIVVECREEPRAVPQGYHWVPIVSTPEAKVVHVTHSEKDGERAVKRELQQIASDLSPPRRVPWAYREWYREILEWVRDALHKNDLHVLGELEQIRASYRGTVLKINTNQGACFLKCSSSTSNDAGVTSVMSAVAPHLVAKPLVADVERRRMILADHGDETGFCALPPDGQRQVMRDLARLHKASMSEFPKLEEVGLPVYSPLWMRDNVTALLDAEELSFMRESDLWRKLHGMQEKLCNALTQIADWEMSLCLVHNDTSDGNLTPNNDGESGGFRFFDFDSSFGSHPIFDLDRFNRDNVEIYAKEMNIADIDGFYELGEQAYRVEPLIRAFRYLDKVRAAEVGGARQDAIDWLIGEFHSLVLRFR